MSDEDEYDDFEFSNISSITIVDKDSTSYHLDINPWTTYEEVANVLVQVIMIVEGFEDIEDLPDYEGDDDA